MVSAWWVHAVDMIHPTSHIPPHISCCAPRRSMKTNEASGKLVARLSSLRHMPASVKNAMNTGADETCSSCSMHVQGTCSSCSMQVHGDVQQLQRAGAGYVQQLQHAGAGDVQQLE